MKQIEVTAVSGLPAFPVAFLLPRLLATLAISAVIVPVGPTAPAGVVAETLMVRRLVPSDLASVVRVLRSP